MSITGPTTKSLILCVVIGLTASQANAEDWLRFRGPNGTGKSSSTLPVSWTPDANLAWKSALPGPGVSCPIVVGDRVFVTCYSGYGIERDNPGDIKDLMRHLVCIDVATGEKKWQKDIPAAQPEDPYTGIGVTAHGYASHTPTSDGEHVFAYFGKSGAFAFDLDGNQVWHKELGKESDPWKWGSSASPIVHDNLLIVTASAESQALVGLNKTTGDVVWRQEAAGLDGMWGTPLLVEIDDSRTDLVMNVAKEMWGLDPATGKLRWHCESTGAEQAHSSPVVGGNTVFAFTGRGGGSVAIKAGGSGDVTDSNVVWSGRDTARFGSPIGHKSNLYLVANGVLSVVDGSTGKRTKQVRLKGGGTGGNSRFGSLDYPSPVIAGDHLYYLNGKGETFVFSLGSSPKQLSVNLVTTDGETFGGTPAISDGRMFLRSNKHLFCVADMGTEVALNASAKLIAKAEPVEEAVAGGRGGPRGGGRGGFGGPGGGRGRGGAGGGGRGGFNPESIFNSRDADKDGKLTKDEVADSPMAQGFDRIDKDGDKAITMEEFREGMRSMFGGGRGGRGGGGRGRGGFGGGREDNRPKRPQRPEAA